MKVEYAGHQSAISEAEAERVLKELGVRHATIKMVECKNWSSIDDPEVVVGHLRKAAELSGMTVVGDSHFKFHPQGLTAGVFLAESHMHMYVYFHSWPERRLSARIDICACRPKNLSACIEYFLHVFDPSYWKIELDEEGKVVTCQNKGR